MRTALLLAAAASSCLTGGRAAAGGQDGLPTINPMAVYTTENGEEESDDFSGDAPLAARFEARADGTAGYEAAYEWRFTLEGEAEPYLVRHEENTGYTFTRAGTHLIELYATFVNRGDTIAYTAAYWAERGPLRATVSESHLEMPNAFSPNGDGLNDVYRAKSGYRSIVEFHAVIFNRWGHKLYEWDDPAGGWDGTSGGHDVAQGVYFVQVRAKGADGKTYNIRRDVNLLRGYTENEK